MNAEAVAQNIPKSLIASAKGCIGFTIIAMIQMGISGQIEYPRTTE